MYKQKNLTQVAEIVLKGLENIDKPVKPEELGRNIGLKLRSIRYGLKMLLEANSVVRQPDLIDLRSYYYSVNEGQQFQDYLIPMNA